MGTLTNLTLTEEKLRQAGMRGLAGSTITGQAERVKELIDGTGLLVAREGFNPLVAQLAGPEGAASIGAQLAGYAAENVGELVRELDSKLKDQMEDLVAGVLPEGAVGSSRLAAGAVTREKLAVGAVTGDVIPDGSIAPKKLQAPYYTQEESLSPATREALGLAAEDKPTAALSQLHEGVVRQDARYRAPLDAVRAIYVEGVSPGGRLSPDEKKYVYISGDKINLIDMDSGQLEPVCTLTLPSSTNLGYLVFDDLVLVFVANAVHVYRLTQQSLRFDATRWGEWDALRSSSEMVFGGAEFLYFCTMKTSSSSINVAVNRLQKSDLTLSKIASDSLQNQYGYTADFMDCGDNFLLAIRRYTSAEVKVLAPNGTLKTVWSGSWGSGSVSGYGILATPLCYDPKSKQAYYLDVYESKWSWNVVDMVALQRKSTTGIPSDDLPYVFCIRGVLYSNNLRIVNPRNGAYEGSAAVYAITKFDMIVEGSSSNRQLRLVGRGGKNMLPFPIGKFWIGESVAAGITKGILFDMGGLACK